MRSMSAMRPAGAIERDADRRDRAETEQAGLDGRDPVGGDPGHRGEPVPLGKARGRDDHRRGAAVEAGRAAGGDGAVAAKGGLQLRQRLDRGVRTRSLVARELQRAFPPLHLDRDDLIGETAGGLRGGEALLRPRREAILIVARELRPRHEVLGVPAGMLAREGVVQPVGQHAVEDLRRAHAVAPPAAAHEIGRPVHVLHPAGDRRVDLARGDLLGGRDDRLRAGAADPVDRHRRHGHREAAADRRLAAWVHPVAGLDDIAHHHRADGRRIEARAAQRLAHHRRAELGGGGVLERAVEGADRGAHGATDDDLVGGGSGHVFFPCCRRGRGVGGIASSRTRWQPLSDAAVLPK